MNLQEAIQTIVNGTGLSRDQMRAVMGQVMTGQATMAQIGALLVALRMKGETIDEIVGAAELMRELVTPVSVDQSNLVDLVGNHGFKIVDTVSMPSPPNVGHERCTFLTQVCTRMSVMPQRTTAIYTNCFP